MVMNLPTRMRSTVRAPNRPDTVTPTRHPGRFPSSHSEHEYTLVTDIEILHKNDSVRATEDALALARIAHLQPVQPASARAAEASQQVLIKVFPLVPVLHLKCFLYDVAEGGIVKTSKPIQFTPELEIPLGTIFFFVSARATED